MKLFKRVLAVLVAVFTLGVFASCNKDVYANAQKKFEKNEYLWTEVEVSDEVKESGVLNIAYAFTGATSGDSSLGKLVGLTKASEKGELIVIINCTEDKIEDVKTNGMNTVTASVEGDTVADTLLSYLSNTATTNGTCVAFGGDAALALFSKC